MNGSRTFLRAGLGVTAPVLGDGTADYTPGVLRTASSTTTFAHAGLKNTSTQSAENETVAATKVYDAFGNEVSASGSWSGPFGYAGNFGYQKDGSGLHLLGHRYYDPSLGRFVTSDPIGDGPNWYAYASSNPVTKMDPQGLISVWMVVLQQLADVVGGLYDGYEFYQEPSLGNGAMLSWSVVGATTPLPGSWVGRGLHNFWRWMTKADEAVEVLGDTGRVIKNTGRGAVYDRARFEDGKHHIGSSNDHIRRDGENSRNPLLRDMETEPIVFSEDPLERLLYEQLAIEDYGLRTCSTSVMLLARGTHSMTSSGSQSNGG
jgi:RHS repeat-associated protein